MLSDLFNLKKVKEGDIVAFENMFRTYYTPLCFYTFKITGRMDVAEEIIQDLFYTIWKDRDKIQIFRSLKSYLYRSVYNRAIRYKEQYKKEEQYKENIHMHHEQRKEFSPEEYMESKELENIIKEILLKMPERRREIFRMHRFQKKKYNEIADTFSISVKTVELEMSKALQVLHQEIGKYIYAS